MPSFRLVTILTVIALALFLGLAIFYTFLTPGLPLDFTLSKAHLISVMSEYTADDLRRHRFGTTVLDSLLPAAYTVAGLFALRRYAPKPMRVVFSLMLLAGMSVDFWENAMNLQMLSGNFDNIENHVMATRLKFLLLLPPLGWALFYWAREGLSRQR